MRIPLVRNRGAIGLLAIAFVVLALAAPGVEAHADHAESFPAPGARLEKSPTEVWIRFTEQVDPALTTFTLLDGSFATFPLAGLTFQEDDFVVRAALPEPLPPGGYALKWETTSTTDGHKTFGAVPFGVQAAAADIDVGTGPSTLRADAVAGKAFAFIGITLVAGAFAFWFLVLPRGFRKGHENILERLGLVGAWLHLAGLLLFGWSQLDLSDQAPTDYFLGTAFGQGLAVRIALALVMVAGLAYAVKKEHVPRGVWAGIGGVTLVAYAFYGMFSHTAGLVQPKWIGAVADAFHLLAVGMWAGGLVAFVVFLKSLPQDQADLAEHLRVVPKRFSYLALRSVLVAVATGVFLMWAVVGFGGLGWTASLYGRLLALKVALALVMVVMGGWNHLVYVARYVKGGSMRTVADFRANVQREVAIGIVVFLLAAILTNTAPGAEDTGPAPAVDLDSPDLGFGDRRVIEVQGDIYRWTVQFHPPPALAADTHYIIEIFDVDRQVTVTDAHWVQVRFHLPPDPSLGSEVLANATRFGNYEVEGAFFPVEGDWEVFVTASTDRGEDTVRFEFTV